MPTLKKPLQQTNRHKVPAKQWNKWPDVAQRVFNETYEVLLHNQGLFLHPKADPSRDEYWTTTAWNAAWTAAEATMTALDGIIAMKGYAQEPAVKKAAAKKSTGTVSLRQYESFGNAKAAPKKTAKKA